MINRNIKIIFWALVVNFLLILGIFFIPIVRNLFQGTEISLMPFVIFFLLGLALIILVARNKIERPLKGFLLLTGISSAGMPVGIFLHNVVYGIFIYFFGSDFWDRTGMSDEPVFFFIALVLCPVGFLVGIIGSITIFVKKRK